MTNRNVMSLAEAAREMGISYTSAVQMARVGDFPGIINNRSSGTRRNWLVSVARFNKEVKGLDEASE
jgi:hypothetical protein